MLFGIVPAAFVVDTLILAAAAVVRATSVNRLVQRRQMLSVWLAVASLLLSIAVRYGGLQGQMADYGRSVEVLLESLAAINLLVLIAVNPLRSDEIPEHFPTIVQDAIIVALFAGVSIMVFGEKVLAMSAVGAVVVGFALQDTLGNAFAGLAIQIEKPFRVGQWIRVGDHEGRVAEVTWRATKLRTKADAFVVLPNNLVSKEAIVNYSEPVIPVRLAVEVGATYSKPPNEVKAAIVEAIRNSPLALADPAPDVMLVEFGSSSINYRARFWVQDYGRDLVAMDQVRTAIYYSFRRHGIEIPFPMQVEYERTEIVGRPPETTAAFLDAIAQVPVFAPLDDATRRELVGMALERMYGAGDVVVRQGAPAGSMFVVSRGELRVTIEPNDTEVARHTTGGFFGEMSLLTGNPRTATVTAVTDCVLMELTAEAFRRFVVEQPAVLEQITAAVLRRQVELDRTRASASITQTLETRASFLARVRKFLKIG
jgi:small-conductance mechanosensitive channel/CRP-like cAMP-binding protein